MKALQQGRYVTLHHFGAAAEHFDLMLEGTVHLETWSFVSQPVSGSDLTGRHIQPHRKDYLHCEGAVSGGRGTVERVDEGTYEVTFHSARRFVVRFRGRNLRGEATFLHEGAGHSWRLVVGAAS